MPRGPENTSWELLICTAAVNCFCFDKATAWCFVVFFQQIDTRSVKYRYRDSANPFSLLSGNKHLGVGAGVTRVARSEHFHRAQHFGGTKLRTECYVIITKCQMLADVNNCDLQNVECHRLLPSCEISSKSAWFAK